MSAPAGRQQSPKYKGHGQGNKVIDLVSFERVSSVEYACQIWSLYLLPFKSYSQGLSVFATESQTDRVTDRVTDRTKTRCPDEFHFGGIKM